MFDELKEVKYSQEIADFKSLIMYFKETKNVRGVFKKKTYLEPNRASTMEFFVNILNNLLSSQ